MDGVGWLFVASVIAMAISGLYLLGCFIGDLVDWLRSDERDERHRIEVERQLAEMRIDQVKQQTLNQLFEQASMAERSQQANEDPIYRSW